MILYFDEVNQMAVPVGWPLKQRCGDEKLYAVGSCRYRCWFEWPWR